MAVSLGWACPEPMASGGGVLGARRPLLRPVLEAALLRRQDVMDGSADPHGRPAQEGRVGQAGAPASRALSSGLTTLPVGLRGSWSTKTNWRGTL